MYIVFTKGGRRIFVTGHAEYDATTLRDEYFRDLDKGKNPIIPKHYFPNDDPTKNRSSVGVLTLICYSQIGSITLYIKSHLMILTA